MSGRRRHRQRISRAEQRANVIQLLKDRKNGIGGYHESLKQFEMMGPPSGEHWPLSAEQIFRAFGVPVDRNDPENSQLTLTLRAESHALLEREIEGTPERPSDLKTHARSIYQAINSVFPRDDGGDADYEWLKEKAQSEVTPVSSVAQGLLVRVEIGIDYLTNQLLNEDLFVQFSRRMTIKEEKAGEKFNTEYYLRYKELKRTTNPETDRPYTTGEAYRQLYLETHLSRSRGEKIVELKEMEIEGRPKRPRGRPRKESA